MEIENGKNSHGLAQVGLKEWTWAAWLSLGLYGWASVLSGAVLPQVTATYTLSPALAGIFVAIPSVGFTIAGLIGGLLSERIGLQRLLVSSVVAIALSLGMVALAQRMTITLLGAFLIGLTGGVLEVGSNGLITSLYYHEAAPQVNRLHVFYGLGSFISPLIVGLFLIQRIPWQINFALASVLGLGLAVSLFWAPVTQRVGLARVNISQMAHLLGQSNVLRAALGSMLFVAAEIGLSSWLVTYLQLEKHLTPSISSACLSVFWLAIIAGRYFNSRLPGSMELKKIILFETLGSSIAVLGIFLGKDPPIILLGLVFTGLMMAGLVPTLLAFACQDSPDFIGSISGIILSATGLGMLIGPGLIGLIMEFFGISISIYFVIFLLAIVTALYI